MREKPPTENLFIDQPARARRDRSLYPEAYGLVDANGHRKGAAHESLTPILPPGRTWTDEEWNELGKRMHANPKAIETNIEMRAYLDQCFRLTCAAVERYGCCGEGPDEHGYCFGYGMCPRFTQALQCVKFVNSYMEWLDQITEVEGLAAVAARLSVPVESEFTNV